MGTTLTGTTPQDTYDSLIKVTDNAPLTGSLKKLTDGLGNDSSLSLSTTAASFSGTLAVTGASTFSSALTAATGSNFTGTSTNSRVLVTAAGVANTILGFNNSGSTANGVVNNAGYIGILQDYPLVVTIADAERMRITGTGNVGIGTSSPAQRLDISNGAIKFDRILTGALTCNDAQGLIYSLNNNIGSQDGLRYTSRTHRFVSHADSVYATIDSDGLKFGSDTAAANALDDYEEGTWTVGLAAPTSGSYTLGTAAASYTKIGRKVTVTGIIIVSSISSPVGAEAYITGLPFTIQNSLNARGAANASFLDSSLSYATTNAAILFLNNETQLRLRLDASTINSGDEIWFTATYFV